jgi:hypothetical protein
VVTPEEFLKAAKVALELMKSTNEAQTASMTQFLDGMSVYLYKSTV